MQDNQVIADGFTMTQNYIIKDISAVASKLCPVVAGRGGWGVSGVAGVEWADQQACSRKGIPTETICTS